MSDVCFHIISKDRGFDPLIAHLRAKNIFCHRSTRFEEIPFDGIAPPGSDSEQAATVMNEDTGGPTHTQRHNRPVARKKRRKSIEKVIALLSKLEKKPSTVMGLGSAINSFCGGKLNDAELAKLIEDLTQRGHVKQSQNKVSYSKDLQYSTKPWTRWLCDIRRACKPKA